MGRTPEGEQANSLGSNKARKMSKSVRPQGLTEGVELLEEGVIYRCMTWIHRLDEQERRKTFSFRSEKYENPSKQPIKTQCLTYDGFSIIDP
jgi:hypothetical protein